jgi:uncharacterized protein YcbX
MAAGRLAGVSQFPVKGMAGIAMERTAVTLQGIPGDRLYAFTRADRLTPFPWLTLREFPGLAAYRPAWQPVPEGRPVLVVETPAGAVLPVGSEALAEEIAQRAGLPLRLHADYRGNHDVAPVSLIARATVEAICREAGIEPDLRRFRMNFVIDGPAPFEENQWVGRLLRIGSVRLAAIARDERCAVITVDPDGSGERQPSVLKATGTLNGACAGVYAAVLEAGEVAIDDAVELDG